MFLYATTIALVSFLRSEVVNYTDFSSQMTGLNLFALLILWLPFRHGELWAWAALWFYPLMFAWHYFHYAKATKFSKVQIAYCILSSVALLLTYTQFN